MIYYLSSSSYVVNDYVNICETLIRDAYNIYPRTNGHLDSRDNDGSLLFVCYCTLLELSLSELQKLNANVRCAVQAAYLEHELVVYQF